LHGKVGRSVSVANRSFCHPFKIEEVKGLFPAQTFVRKSPNPGSQIPMVLSGAVRTPVRRGPLHRRLLLRTLPDPALLFARTGDVDTERVLELLKGRSTRRVLMRE
jgi:hypothetical protein